MVNVSDERVTEFLPAGVLPRTPMWEIYSIPKRDQFYTTKPRHKQEWYHCLQKCGSCADVRYVTKISVSQSVPKHVLLL